MIDELVAFPPERVLAVAPNLVSGDGREDGSGGGGAGGVTGLADRWGGRRGEGRKKKRRTQQNDPTEVARGGAGRSGQKGRRAEGQPRRMGRWCTGMIDSIMNRLILSPYHVLV